MQERETVTYCVTESCFVAEDGQEVPSYDVCAVVNGKIVKRMKDISTDRLCVECFADTLNREDVELCQFEDVTFDFIYSL